MNAGVVKQVNAKDLKSFGEILVGSSPATRTIFLGVYYAELYGFTRKGNAQRQ